MNLSSVRFFKAQYDALHRLQLQAQIHCENWPGLPVSPPNPSEAVKHPIACARRIL